MSEGASPLDTLFAGDRRVAVVWLAGLFEGEGSFNMPHGVAKSIKIDMTDRDIIDRVQQIFGGSVCLYEPDDIRHRPWWRWTATTMEAEILVREMLPFLGERRAQRAREYLAEREARATKRAARQTAVSDRRERVRALRGQGLTQAKIAQEVGLDRSTVGHILLGRYDSGEC